jgi:hypothetical protein
MFQIIIIIIIIIIIKYTQKIVHCYKLTLVGESFEVPSIQN